MVNLKKKTSYVLSTRSKIIRFNNNVFYVQRIKKRNYEKIKTKKQINRNRNPENWCNFKFQKKHCVNLLRKTKKPPGKRENPIPAKWDQILDK